MFTSVSRILIVCGALMFMTGAGMEAKEVNRSVFEDNMQYLMKPPRVYDCPEVGLLGKESIWYKENLYSSELRNKDSESTVRAIYYDGVPYKGKPTRIFAYIGMPKVAKGEKVPGIVLVHGGGGSAFESWVRLWNARGYAAIAMDTCGRLGTGPYGGWPANQYGGNPNCGGFGEVDLPIGDQWTYQAVSAVVLANSLLRAQKEVDPKRVGITGISWGGYLTCIASGVDNRFKFSVPVYGSGFLGDNSAWLANFKDMGKEKADKWLSLWDPSVYLPSAKMPMMWITGTKDHAYPMDSHQKSYRLPKGKRSLTVTIDMIHTHGGPGEIAPEIHAFVDSYCLGGKPLATITKQGYDNGVLWVEFSSKSKITSASLCYTTDTGLWWERNWMSVPAQIKGKRASAEVPENASVYYINLTDERNLIVSGEFVERAK